MKRLVLFAVLASVLVAIPASASAKQPKVDVCHWGDGGWQLLNVSQKALKAHGGHGDGLPGQSVPGMDGFTFNDACVPTPDEVPDEADLSITKTDSIDPVVAGDLLTYTIAVTNNGPDPATNVVVEDVLPVGVTPATTDECVPTCMLGTIASNDTASYDVTVVVDATTTGMITNTAEVESDVADPDLSNNSVAEGTIVVAPPVADIDIEKLTNGVDADGPNGIDVPQIAPGDAVTWSYLVTNTGTATIGAADVVVTDDRLGVVSGGPISGDNGNFLLEPGERWVYEASGTAQRLLAGQPDVVPSTCPAGVAYQNTGTVTVPGASDTDPSHYCNPAETTFAVAYTDIVDDGGGYDAAVDVLIAKLIDGPGAASDGLIGVGDLVILDQYPTSFDLTGAFGNFGDKGPHVVTSVDVSSSSWVAVRSSGNTFGWETGSDYHDLLVMSDFSDLSFFTDWRGAADDYEYINLAATTGAPSIYVVAFRGAGDSDIDDNQFVDVEVTAPSP